MNVNFLDTLKNDGIVKIPQFLNEVELSKIQKIVKQYSAVKGAHKSYFSTNYYQLILKIIKFDFKRFFQDITLLNLAKKKKLNYISDKIFNKRSYLKFIDGYFTPISNKDLLPWHTDQAYHGDEKNYDEFVNPDHAHIKFFIYLTPVGPNNGCTSYIPKSHKIGYAIRKGIYEKVLEYSPYFTLTEFRNFISKPINLKYINNYLKDSNAVNNFLKNTEKLEQGNNLVSEFDFAMNSGDAIIFDEGGVHKGSKSLINDRLVLRYLYSSKK
tara:strand:+ start:149 stop:955 length:807 start_codon:yes stop_codon:yes gene_type:complete